jgi:hypothetical protein
MRKLFTLILPIICGLLYANPANFSVATIPDSLKKDAYGIVRFSRTEFDYKSEKSGVEKHSYAITVLNKNSKEMGDFIVYGDKFRKLNKFSATLYDANGKLLRKFKMSDINISQISAGLADDNVYYFFTCQIPGFPFTIHYEYEIDWKNGNFSFPVFAPQSGYSLAVEKADYILNLPADIKIRQKVLNNMPETPAISEEEGRKEYLWSVANLKAIEQEVFSPQLKELRPTLFVSPESFVYDNVRGRITDWNSYGQWVFGLLRGRDELSLDVKNQILALTRNADTDREKVKILYDYLGNTTRYVSIQLGIGGYQPMLASEVNKTGFGDCKALSFYLQTMLETIGIQSNYIVIRLDPRNKTLLNDYANFHEMNHVILQVPLENDTLWLECTNPKIPFGFIHNGISGHEALKITSEGGYFCHLPDYPDSLNVDKNSIQVKINADGSAGMKSRKEWHIKTYDDNFGFNLLPTNKQIDKLRRAITLPDATVNAVRVAENKSSMPSFLVDYDVETSLYGTLTGNRLFVPVNPFRSQYDWFKKQGRKYDIDVRQGFNDIDEIFIAIPDNYEIESLPESFSLSTVYGNFASHIISQDNGIVVRQSFYFPQGRYSVTEYNAIRDFFKQINAIYDSKIVLRKK